MSKALIILSGGMDSATLAYHLRDEGYDLIALSFDYGQRHARELVAAREIAKGLGIPHHQVTLTGLMSLLPGSSLTDERIDVPHGHYTAPTMKKTVVAGRNALMLALGWAVAAAHGMDRLAAAVHAGDHAIYPDCRADFIAALNHALILGTREVASQNLELYTPFLHWTKTDIAWRGAVLGVPFDKTWTCYDPQWMGPGEPPLGIDWAHLNRDWFAGFVEGEGCFTRKTEKTGKVYPRFSISQKDNTILQEIHAILGFGHISKKRTETGVYLYEVSGANNCRVIAEILDGRLFSSRRRRQYEQWVNQFGLLDGKLWVHCSQCGACVERREAFREADLVDPTPYLEVA